MNKFREIHSDDNGNLPHYAWPGGYPLAYVTADNGTMCPDCANSKESKQTDKDCPDDNQWRIIAYDINYEDTGLFCDNCNKRIESAYNEN